MGGTLPGRSTPVYIDANLFIAWYSQERSTPVDVREGVTDILRRVDRGELHLVLSTIHKPECKSASAFMDSLFAKKRHVTIVDVSVRIANRAREYMGAYNLKPFDAIHLATATLYECAFLYCRDGKLLRTKYVDKTAVCLPPQARQRELDLSP